MQPCDQPRIVEAPEPVEAIGELGLDLDHCVLGPVDPGLDRRRLEVLVIAADYPDRSQRDVQVHRDIVPRPPMTAIGRYNPLPSTS
jgi:hypothetical protein